MGDIFMSHEKYLADENERLSAEVAGLRKQLALQVDAMAGLSAEVDRLATALDASQRNLKNLLAVIHRDGWQYLGQHGEEKAFLDALDIIPATVSRAEAAESLVAVLRVALEEAPDYIDNPMTGDAAPMLRRYLAPLLTLTPASAVARIKSEAYREAAQRILNDPRRWPTVIANHIVHDLCEEADRMEKEAANGL